ncbi:MAG: histidine phosphatase family protein [Candidatus Omnitrophica bacterium]|nr:histidine phosphatase family protein [Candidatus Omnitrophota bacterium]
MKRLILIRHGETQYSKKGQYCGFEDASLNATGVEQSHRLKQRLRSFKVDKVYSSDLKRCLDTACIVFGNKVIHKRRGLREINFGALVGLRYDDLKKEYPELYRLWPRSPEKLKMPKGEHMLDFTRRVKRCFNEIARKNRRKVVVIVAHGGSLRVILLKLLKKTLDKMWEIEQETAAFSVIDFVGGVPKILKINDTSHLKG